MVGRIQQNHHILCSYQVPASPAGAGTGSGDVFSATEGRLVVGTPGLVLSVQLGTARALPANWGSL